MANLKQLKQDNAPIYPVTHTQAVFDDNGVTIEQKLNSLIARIEVLEGNVEPPIEPTDELSITMSNNLIKIDIGENANLIPVMYPLDYEDRNFAWSSSNEVIATVNQEGLVESKFYGTCKIRATHIATSKYVECSVEVVETVNQEAERVPVEITGWEQGGLDWSGYEDDTKNTSVRSAYIPCNNYPVEITPTPGMVWSKIHFYDSSNNPLTNENQGFIAEGESTHTQTPKIIVIAPSNAKYFRVQVTSSTYNYNTSLTIAKNVLAHELLIESSEEGRYDEFKSYSVLLNTRNVNLVPNQQYQLLYKECPIGYEKGITFISDNTSVATVNSLGNITAKGLGICNIIARNNEGNIDLNIKVTVAEINDSGVSFNSLTGATDSDKLKNAFTIGGEITGNGNSYTVSSLESPLSTNLTLKNIKLVGSLNKTNITLNSSNKTLIFKDCTFDNTGLWYSNFSGTIRYERCTFENWQYCPNTVMTNNVTVEFVDCLFKDNKPNESEWIANTSWERFWAYNPINLYGNNITLRVNGCSFNNIMSRCVVYAKDNYTGSVLEIDNNTFYRTEGHVINMESPCSGFVDNNHFYLVGDLRGQICHETEQQTGVGGNCVFVHGTTAIYCDVSVKNNIIKYAIENGIEGGLKEVAYNYIEGMGYRHSEGIENPSMEGIWGSARNGIHHNVVINPNMDGMRIENQGTSGNVPCTIHSNIMIYNSLLESKVFNHVGISVVSKAGNNEGIITRDNTVIGFYDISKIDADTTSVDYVIQTESEYAYS